MGIPIFPDAVAIAPAAILGLLGVWLGFRRWLVTWPMPWLVPLFGASAAAGLAAWHFAVHPELAALLYVSGTAGKSIVAALAFLATFVGLSMFMSNLRARVVVWTGDRHAGATERVFGGLLGVVCGLLLVAIPYIVHEMTRAVEDGDPAWARESLLLPHFKSAGEAARSALSSYLPPSDGRQPDR